MKKIWVNYFFMRNLYMKFQNPSIHCSKVSNFTEKWENQSKFKNSVFLSKFDRKFSKVNQVIYSSAPTSYILFEISCTQDFQILFSKGNNSEKKHNSDKKKIQVNYFFMRNTHMKFQLHDMLHSKVNTHTHTHTHTHRQTDKQTIQKQYALPTFSKLGA